ncbi:MAG: hypothetical protein JNL43_07905 [Flavobacteriales bacterium]|nr:hypothetical protein [Flavobacteriales bacterium]
MALSDEYVRRDRHCEFREVKECWDRAEDDVGIDDALRFTSRLRFFAYHVRLMLAAKLSTTFCGTL